MTSHILSLTRNERSLIEKPLMKREKTHDCDELKFFSEWEKSDAGCNNVDACECNQPKAYVEWAEQNDSCCSDNKPNLIGFKNPSLPSIPFRTFGNSTLSLLFKKTPLPMGNLWSLDCKDGNFWSRIAVNMFLNQDLYTHGTEAWTEFSMSITLSKRSIGLWWVPWKGATATLLWKYSGNLTNGNITPVGSSHSNYISLGNGPINYTGHGISIHTNNVAKHQIWHPIKAANTLFYGPSSFQSVVVAPDRIPSISFCKLVGIAFGKVRFVNQFHSCAISYP